MFWSQVDDNSIVDLLLKDDVTLEELLDHESILQECKIQNDKLIPFFCVNKNFQTLQNYILVTPSADIEEKVRFKYPSIVSEVLTCDAVEINEILINGLHTEVQGSDKNFIDRVFDCLEIETCINPLTISYIIKILLNILKYNNDTVMSIFIKRAGSLDLLIKHVENNAISAFFTEFLMCDEECTTSRIKWLNENRFVYKCAQLLSETEHRNNEVQDLLCEVIRASWKYFANKAIRDEIRNQFNSKLFLNLIFSHLSNPKAECNLITGCLKVVRTIVDFEIDSEEKKIDNVKEMLLKHIESINLLLSNPPKQIYDPMPTTIGRITPFGPTRLEIVYLLESLLKLNDVDINKGIGKTHILNVLLAAISQYRWNTMFQLGLLKIFDVLFGDLTVNCQYKSLLSDLVQNYDIYPWFIATINETAQCEKPRPGTMGMLWKMGNHLNSLLGSTIVDEILNKEFEEFSLWSKVVVDYLEPRNNRNIVVPPKIDSCFGNIKMVDIDEDSVEAVMNHDKFSELCRNKSDNLDDIFGTSKTDVDDDEWIENQLSMPNIPIDDFPNVFGTQKKSLDDGDDDSSSDDEISPSVIKQKIGGTQAKYLFSDSGVGNGDLVNLCDVPNFDDEPFCDPWGTSKATEDDTAPGNWATFH